MTLTLHIGNKNYSSWSLRGWLAVRSTGAPFEEVLHQLHVPDSEERLGKFAPNRRVPCLIHDGLTIWDSLAICEYLAETFPAAGMWPAERKARATARALSAEMHSGFFELRTHMPMNVRADKRGKGMTPGVRAEITRVREIWRAAARPFLFGAFGIADCMFAPVAVRFRTYGVALDGKEAAYASAVLEHPFLQEWTAAARVEPWTVEEYDQV
jgi:glutathione S-transferase